MKILIVAGSLFVAAACFAQQAPSAPPPTLSAAQKLDTREAQHKLDAVQKQIADINIQFQQIQNRAQAQMTELAKQQSDAQKLVDAALEADQSGVDKSKWTIDADSLTFKAVPAPAAPANASTQPTKPVPSSSGEAAPPVQQAKK